VVVTTPAQACERAGPRRGQRVRRDEVGTLRMARCERCRRRTPESTLSKVPQTGPGRAHLCPPERLVLRLAATRLLPCTIAIQLHVSRIRSQAHPWPIPHPGITARPTR
jgi:hypothetical protein